MPEITLIYRGMTYIVGADANNERAWEVLQEGKVVLTGHERSTRKSSAFRIAVQQAQAAIDDLLDDTDSLVVVTGEPLSQF